MKARLLYPDRDFDAQRALPAHADALRRDLALDTLLRAMAAGDAGIEQVARNVLTNAPGNDAAVILYRQAIVRDALAHPDVVRGMYAIAIAALEEKRKSWWGFTSNHPSSVLYSALQGMRCFLARLRALRDIAEAHADAVRSHALRELFAMLRREFDDAWIARAAAQLEELKFADGTLLGARLGPGGESEDYVLRRPPWHHANWFRRLLERAPSAYTVRVAPRDLTGAKTLGEMRDRGISDVANALAQSVDHIQAFFEMLRAELAFHVGCVNLHERLAAAGVPTCLPELLAAAGHTGFRARGLRDASLVLAREGAVAGNDIDATDKPWLVVTGANQGGKSTFLRSLGLALLMTQAGLFVAADAFAVAPCTGVFTHYKREEDATMQLGKLDEELARIGDIADHIRPGAWLLCNESFASTNEREGSELARQMVEAMLERGIHVAFVSHLYSFTHAMYERHPDTALFLRAERLPDGSRSFKLAEGAPRTTSHGEDLYRAIFGDAADAPHADVLRAASARQTRHA